MLPHGAPMCQVAKIKPAHAERTFITVSEGNLGTRTRNFYFKPELGVLSCSRLLRSSVWHLGQPTACNNIPTRPPRLKNRTALFVQEAGGLRQRMGVLGMRELVILILNIVCLQGSVVCNQSSNPYRCQSSHCCRRTFVHASQWDTHF